MLLIIGGPLFARASARWIGRLCVEVPVTLHQAQLLTAALAGLPNRTAALALEAGCAELGACSAPQTPPGPPMRARDGADGCVDAFPWP